jgi:predicted metalloprotease with PDZ domain
MKRTSFVSKMSLSTSVLIVFQLACLFPAHAQNAPMKLYVDATQASRRMIHVKMTIPLAPGPVTLVYPKWIPGAHSPVGPINDLMGLKFTLGETPISWRRDDVDMYAFHLQVPAGAGEIQAEFYLTGTTDEVGYFLGDSSAPDQLMLDWDQVVLYPLGPPADAQSIQAVLTLPAQWKFATALTADSQRGQIITFKPASLTTLIDSPLLAGTGLREFDITPPGETRPHRLDIAAESAAALEVPDDVIAAYRNLVSETGALFRSRHYDHYNFLVWLHGTYEDGLEHHQSSDNRLPEMGMADPQWRLIEADLLSHEMTHSWNGKYRRPAGLATPNYQEPMKGDLLWVYEGLTNYLGEVLAARSGLWTPADYRDRLADDAAQMDTRPGSSWRSLQDTATSAQLLYGSSPEWQAWRRTTDYYPEGSLVWLEVDTVIRSKSNGKKSLDDFCRAFAGGTSGSPTVVTYTFDDVVSTLNQIQPYDWREFFQSRLNSLSPHAPLGGIENAGWKLVYTDTPSELGQALEAKHDEIDARYSFGAILKSSGAVVDVLPGTPAFEAGLAPGMKIVSVNGRQFSPQALREVLKSAVGDSAPLEMLVNNEEKLLTLQINYHSGERYPHLQRDTSRPDTLDKILAPLSHAQ